MKKLRIEAWPIDKVKPYELNAKEHPEEQIDELAKSIARFGWDQPIVVWKDGTIIKGHGRRLAAIKLGYKEVPVLVRDDITEDEAKAARLSDNRVISTIFDTELLKRELAALSLSGDVKIEDLAGFTPKELEFLSVDLGQMDDGAFVDDIGAAVETQKHDNAEKMSETAAGEVSLGEGFGFKKMTPELARQTKSFMANLEARFKKKGAEAWAEFLAETIEIG